MVCECIAIMYKPEFVSLKKCGDIERKSQIHLWQMYVIASMLEWNCCIYRQSFHYCITHLKMSNGLIYYMENNRTCPRHSCEFDLPNILINMYPYIYVLKNRLHLGVWG